MVRTRLRKELDRAAKSAGIGHVTPHQLRHTYATALVNAGVSLQALMAILGHVSAEMSLRYGHLFDTTVRAEYERALELAKQPIGALPHPNETTHPRASTDDWRATPTVKTALAGGYCLRAPAQGPCRYANICEHCPSFHTDHQLPARADRPTRRRGRCSPRTPPTRGWDAETERHLRLINRLTTLIDEAATRPTAM